MADILCVSPYCATKGRHTPDCDTPACRGCQPRQAADGLYLCRVCASRMAEDPRDLADLWDALGEALLGHGGGGEKTSGSSTESPMPNPDVMQAREDIRQCLISLARLIMDERGFQAPTVRRPLRLPQGFIGPAPMRIYTDTSTRTLAEYVARSAQWLAAHPAADEHARDLRDLATDGRIRGMAYPHRTDRVYIGQCPIPVQDGDTKRPCGQRLYATQDAQISCRACGTTAIVDQWRAWIVGDCTGQADAYEAAAYLAMRWARPVDPALVRKWASLGRISAVMEPDPDRPDQMRVVRVGRRTMYDLGLVREYAAKLWGLPVAT